MNLNKFKHILLKKIGYIYSLATYERNQS